MENSNKTFGALLFFLLGVMVFLNGCESKPPALITIKVSEGTEKFLAGFGRFQKITKYDINFQAKGTAIVNFTTEAGAKFTVQKLDAAQLQAVMSMLLDSRMKFDTLRKEYTVGLH